MSFISSFLILKGFIYFPCLPAVAGTPNTVFSIRAGVHRARRAGVQLLREGSSVSDPGHAGAWLSCLAPALTLCLPLLQYVHHSPGTSKRGFGIDCAILSRQVYISQILVASALGSVVDAVGTVRVIPMVASVGSFLGFLTAAFLVIYPEVSEEAKEEQKGLSSQPLGEGASGSAEKPTVLKLSRKEAPQGLVETESMV